jgi:TolB-like protein
MKKTLSVLLLCGIAAVCFPQATGTLDMALTNVKTYVEAQLPQNTRVVIADFSAPSNQLSAYIADALSNRLFNSKRLTIVERSMEVMRSLTAETTYQLSGEVSDDSIQSIGYKTGAEVVVTGSISGAGDQYRLTVKLTGIKTGELQGQWSDFLQTDTVLNSLLGNSPPVVQKPRWISEPLTARAKYESSGGSGAAVWYYDVGVSNKTASEQLARTRARQNIQQMTAENIASDMKARIDITSLSLFQHSAVEDAEYRIEMALTNAIKTRVPRYETLEWYVETGSIDGKDWYLAYVLVRFPRTDIITLVEQMDTPRIADTIIRQLPPDAVTQPVAPVQQVSPPTSKAAVVPDARSELIQEMEAVREYALEGIRDALTDH